MSWPYSGHMPAGVDHPWLKECHGNCDGVCEEAGRRLVVAELAAFRVAQKAEIADLNRVLENAYDGWHDAATCPKCKDRMFNPCDPGCCNAYYCRECDIVYHLAISPAPGSDVYRQLACDQCGEEACPKHKEKL